MSTKSIKLIKKTISPALVLIMLLGSLIFNNISRATIAIYPSNIILSKKVKRIRITLLNQNKFKSYITMQPEEKLCITQNSKTQQTTSNILEYVNCHKIKKKETNISKKLKFIPNKFILNPGQKKTIWAIWNGELPKKNHLLTFYAKNHAKESIKEIKTTKKNQKKSIQISIITRIEASALILKKDSEIQQQKPPIVSIKDKQLTITNPGNTITKIKFKTNCKKNKKHCQKILHNNKEIKLFYSKSKSSKTFQLSQDQPITIKYYNIRQKKYIRV